MHKKPMSSIGIKTNLFFIFISLLFEVLLITDVAVPKDVKIICSSILLPIILICFILLIKDFFLRKKYIKKQKNEKEEIISSDEWNFNQRNLHPSERTLYNNEINNALGENITFIKKTDKYRNTVIQTRNDNILDWIAINILAIMLNILAILALLYNKSTIIYMSIVLLISIPTTIHSILQLKRIRKLKLKIKLFQIFKFIFLLSIILLVFGGLIITIIGFNIDKNIIGKIFLFFFIFIMFVGFIAFIYQTFLVLKTIIFKNK